MDWFLMLLLMLVGLFMMLVVLIQRGRGGGLAGAFGGAGGSSAFGTKAGDVFTKITIVCALIWFCLAGFSGMALRANDKSSRFKDGENVEPEKKDDEDSTDLPTKSASDAGLPDFGNLPVSPTDGEAPELPATPEPGDVGADGSAPDVEMPEGAESPDGDAPAEAAGAAGAPDAAGEENDVAKPEGAENDGKDGDN